VLIEYVAIRIMLKGQMRFRHVLPAFFIIYLITVPVTHILGLFLIWLAELCPLMCEPLAYRWSLAGDS